MWAGPLTLAMLLVPTAVHASEVPVNTTPPSISGTPISGQTLTASPGSWTEEPTEFRFGWERCRKFDGTCIWYGDESSESQSHVVVPEDVGNMLRVRVTAVNDAGKSAPAKSVPVEIEKAWRFVSGLAKVEVARWRLGRGKRVPPVKGKTLTIGVLTGYCLGEPRPVIDHIRVVERPETVKRPFKSAVITAFVRFPAPTEVVGTVNEGEPVPGCAGLGYGLSRRIKLKRPVRRLFIFDGNRSPPRPVLRPKKGRHRFSRSAWLRVRAPGAAAANRSSLPAGRPVPLGRRAPRSSPS